MSFQDIECRCGMCEAPVAIRGCCFEAAMKEWQRQEDERKAAEAKAELARKELERKRLEQFNLDHIFARCPYCRAGFRRCEDTGFRLYTCGLGLAGDNTMGRPCGNTTRDAQAKWGELVRAAPING